MMFPIVSFEIRIRAPGKCIDTHKQTTITLSHTHAHTRHFVHIEPQMSAHEWQNYFSSICIVQRQKKNIHKKHVNAMRTQFDLICLPYLVAKSKSTTTIHLYLCFFSRSFSFIGFASICERKEFPFNIG